MRAHIKAWLEILAAEPEADARYYALAQEFRDVPPTLVDDVLTEARRLVSPQTFNVLQSVATEQLAWVGLGDAALALARRIEDRAERSVALARLSAGLPAGERDAIVAEVLSSLSPEDGEERWVFGLGFLLPSLTLPQLLSLVRVTRGLRTPAVRARLQAGLLSYLPRCQRRAFGREVLHACRRCEPSDRARLVAALAFRLPYDLWSPLIDLASTDNKIGVVTATLAALASRTPTRLVRAWLDYMCTLPPDTPGRALLLASLAIRLPKSARQSAQTRATGQPRRWTSWPPTSPRSCFRQSSPNPAYRARYAQGARPGGRCSRRAGTPEGRAVCGMADAAPRAGARRTTRVPWRAFSFLAYNRQYRRHGHHP